MSIARPYSERGLDSRDLAADYGLAVSQWINSKNGRRRSSIQGRRFVTDNAEIEIVKPILQVMSFKDRLIVLESSDEVIEQTLATSNLMGVGSNRFVVLEGRVTKAEEEALRTARLVVARQTSINSPFAYLSGLSGRRLDGYVFPLESPRSEPGGVLTGIVRAASLTRKGGSLFMAISGESDEVQSALALEGFRPKNDQVKNLSGDFKAMRIVI